MILLLDAGNTRIKWALISDGVWKESGVIPVDKVLELKTKINNWESVEQLWISNVAGKEIQDEILKMGVAETNFIQAKAMCCGVRNHYANPAQLGSDRWLALIAAWALIGKSCLVVDSGTATTIDALTDQGEFLGGLILPGIHTMRNSLMEKAAGINTESGVYREFPCCTEDAVTSGAIQATSGAIARQKSLLNNRELPIVLSGGAAELLEPHLGNQVLRVENLVLRGIELASKENKAT